jgi:hypothetical protein
MMPLVIDPRIAYAVPATSTGGDLGDPDVSAFSRAFIAHPVRVEDAWHVVWAHFFGGNDWDCYVQDLDLNLAALGAPIAIDVTASGWMRPRIASINVGSSALVVAQVRLGTNPTKIAGRFVGGVNQFDIATATVDSLRPDVGGDASGSIVIFRGAFYTVVWEHAYSATDHDIFARQVATDGTLRPIVFVQTNTANQTNPSISKSCGPLTGINGAPETQRYTIVYQQTAAFGDQDIHGALLTWDGNPVLVGGSTTFPIDTSTANDTFPQASSPARLDSAGRRRILAVYERTSSNLGDVAAAWFDHDGAILGRANVTALENDPVRLGWQQYRPSVDSDGVRFGIAYHEVYQANTTVNDLDTRMTLVGIAGSNLLVEEAGAILGFSGNREFNVQVASRYSADGAFSTRYCTANDRDNTNNTFGIDARTYDGIPPTAISHRATACGAQTISASGETRIGGTVVFTIAPALPLAGMLAGAAIGTPVGGCPGCTLGASGATLLGTTLTIAIPFDVGLIGAPLSVQGFGFDPAGGPCLGQLHLSDTVDIVVQ